MADQPHPSTHSEAEHHEWIRQAIRAGRIAFYATQLVAFLVSLGHSQEDARKRAGQIAAGAGIAGAGLALSGEQIEAEAERVVAQFSRFFGHLFR
ncbi:hypothetical protein Rhe02_06130 [Rhizocola hellebori]|uniref:Uncharacterized protein n=1 Tax=Rhizocola hellebori TaxID=1392758 RepID=A0A8J3VDL1_9ACTN|nr:hypothetical protein Rhe02_06130 [Rhizocola hellebori]